MTRSPSRTGSEERRWAWCPTRWKLFGMRRSEGEPGIGCLQPRAERRPASPQTGTIYMEQYIIPSGALRELSVAFCRGNASLCRSGAYVATSAASRAPMRGLAQPLAEVV
jgi:hypothetical protein